MSDMTLWGFDGSTYVRTVKMVLAEKGVTDFKQVPLNVLKGDPKTPEHRERHPFGKVPVLDHDGARILETTAIARYLNDVLPGNRYPFGAQGSRAYGHDHRPRRLLRLRLPDRRCRRLPFVSGFRRREERGDAQGWPREWPQDDRTRDEDKGLFPLHRRRLEFLPTSISRQSPSTSRSRRTKKRFSMSPALRTGGRRYKPCRVSRTPNPISADDADRAPRRRGATSACRA